MPKQQIKVQTKHLNSLSIMELFKLRTLLGNSFLLPQMEKLVVGLTDLSFVIPLLVSASANTDTDFEVALNIHPQVCLIAGKHYVAVEGS